MMNTTLMIPGLSTALSMAMDPNSGFFNNAQNFAVINGHFTEVTVSKHIL